MMAECVHTARAARQSETTIMRLALGFLVLMAICFWAMAGHAAEAAAPAAPSEASGEDLYKRGYYPEALEEWKKAVDVHKDGGAAFRLGEEYFDAKVVQRDVATALKYYKFGAERGDARAQMDLGSFYDKGWGVTRDAAEAAKWYEAAAKQGMAEAQYNIATMYEAGEGVTKDERKAYMYFLLAVDAGFPQFANKELEKLSKTMNPEDIKQATLLARDFKPVIGAPEAATR
ncbi:tetratricopeptide repeat protein [Parvibaculum sedimenti]|nr:tetratricopeptide repeat protein [Parvibaculum sedimenti]